MKYFEFVNEFIAWE